MSRYCIDVLCIEFDEGQRTLWVQGKAGTVLRIKTTGKITAKSCNEATSGSHADVMVSGDISICVGNDATVESP